MAKFQLLQDLQISTQDTYHILGTQRYASTNTYSLCKEFFNPSLNIRHSQDGIN